MPTPHATLYVVATPLGNIEDLTARAARILREASIVAAEDTRVAHRLLAHLGARPRLVRCDAHVERAGGRDVLAALGRGESVALVTDAGTPGISDPGARLVRDARAAGHTVVPIPGPSAVSAALSAAGFPASAFRFVGFLPRQGGSRRRAFEAIAHARETVVLFEAPGRLARTLADLASCGDPQRRLCVLRELTKRHEEIWTGPIAEASRVFSAREVLGEVTVVIEGRENADLDEDDVPDDASIISALEARGTDAQATAEVSRALGIPRKRVYALALSLRAASPRRREP